MERNLERMPFLRRAITSPKDSRQLRPRAFPEEHLAITAALLAHLNELPDFRQSQRVRKIETEHPDAWLLFFDGSCIGLLRRNHAAGTGTPGSFLLFNVTAAAAE